MKRIHYAAAALIGVLLLAGVYGILRPVPGTSYQRDAHIEGIAGRPPAPNFYNPVDYVAWLDEQLGAGKPESFSKTYAQFWQSSSSDDGMPDPDKRIREELRTVTMGPTWAVGDHPELEAYFNSIGEYLEVFKVEIKKPGYRFRPKPDPTDPCNPMLIRLPWIASSTYATDSLMALSWRAGPNQPSRMLDAWRNCLRHAGHLQSTNQLLLCINGTKIRLAVYDSIRAAAGVLLDKKYREVLGVLDEFDPGPVNLREPIRSAWGGTLGFVQALYPEGRMNEKLAEKWGYVAWRQGRNNGIAKKLGEILGLLPSNEGQDNIIVSEIRRTRTTPSALAAAADEHYARLLELVKRPLTGALLNDVVALGQRSANGELAEHPFQPTVQPDLHFYVRQQLTAATSARGTRLVLALLEYHAAHGKCPVSLSQVCDNAAARTDPFSETEFKYRQQPPDERNSDAGFVLYSVGEDGEDNNGTYGHWRDFFGASMQERDIVFWPIQPRN